MAVEGQSLHIERPTETGFGVFETTFALQTVVIRPTEYHHPQIFGLLQAPLCMHVCSISTLCMCRASEKWVNIWWLDLLSTKNMISEETYLFHKVIIIIVKQVVPAHQLSTLYHSLLQRMHKAPFCINGDGQQTPGHSRLICWAFPLASHPSSIPSSSIRLFCLILSTTATCLGSVWG